MVEQLQPYIETSGARQFAVTRSGWVVNNNNVRFTLLHTPDPKKIIPLLNGSRVPFSLSGLDVFYGVIPSIGSEVTVIYWGI